MADRVDWTGERVVERLVAAFLANPDMPARASQGDLERALRGRRPIDGPDLVTVVLRVLGPSSEGSRGLLAWAWARPAFPPPSSAAEYG